LWKSVASAVELTFQKQTFDKAEATQDSTRWSLSILEKGKTAAKP
jgi:hypothetical protein